eukprot:gene30699-37095_t
MTEAEPLKDTLNAHWKTNKSNFGYRMLAKMGWTEDKGLGKNEDGMSAHVKMKKREDGLGLGMETVQDDKVGSKAWGSTVTSFNSVLQVLKNNLDEIHRDSEEDSKSKKRSKKSKKDKKDKKRKRSDDNDDNDNEVAESSEGKKDKKKRAIISVGIKYKKFRDAKDLKSKTDSDRAAIFGAAAAK